MPLPLVPLIGGLLGLGGSLIQGAGQSRAAKQANQQNEQQRALINMMAQGMMQGGSSPYEAMAGQLFGQVQRQGPTYMDPVQSGSVFSAGAMNGGQDSLMQMLRGSGGAGQIGNPMNGFAFDTSGFMQASQAAESRALDEATRMINGGSNSLTSRYSSGQQRQKNNAIAGMTEQANLRRQQFNFGAQESAANRMMQTAGMMQQNNQFNAANQFQANSMNANAGQQQLQSLMQLLNMGSTINQQGRNANAGLLGIMAGLPQAQANPGAGYVGGAINQAGGALTDLWGLMQMMNSLKSK